MTRSSVSKDRTTLCGWCDRDCYPFGFAGIDEDTGEHVCEECVEKVRPGEYDGRLLEVERPT